MTAVFVDTNVLLYSVDDANADKRDRARAWLAACWRLRCGRLSTQVVHEFYANARRKFAAVLPAEEARAEVRRYLAWRPWIVDLPTVETAWAIESRYRMSYWDALMVAAAQHQGCRYLLTEDLQHEQILDGVQIINPFLCGPELLSDTTS